MPKWYILILLTTTVVGIFAKPNNVVNLHPHPKGRQVTPNEGENDADFWNNNAAETLAQRLTIKPKPVVAKNVILFLGDGMSIPTLAAARASLGDENAQLSFDQFPHLALSKTYCVDYQVADSACSATAYLSGVKANMGTIGVTAAVPFEDCAAMTNVSNHVHSIAYYSQEVGKSTGLVTTTSVTDASPTGVFGHTSNRDWEADTDILESEEDPSVCMDLATQLITSDMGKKLNVIMGGGRRNFLPRGAPDEEGDEGYRTDGVNLIQQWKDDKTGEAAEYIWNREELLNLDTTKTDYVLGLFDTYHCPYNLDRDKVLDPSLEEMTEAAIKILSKDPNGYFLFVEGGLIDKAHHQAWSRRALDETLEFSKAIQKAVDLTNEDDTLIVVTADHAHTLSVSGYPVRHNDIFGIAYNADDGLPYTTLNYANGPGFRPPQEDGSRYDQTNDDFSDKEYRYPGLFPLDSETHGGDDVAIFARGPWAHLFTGVMEQHVIPHIMSYASCVGQGATACDDDDNGGSGAGDILPHIPIITLLITLIISLFN